MHYTSFWSSANLCYQCHFFTLQPTSRRQLSTALFCHPGLPEIFVDARERLSAPPQGVKLLMYGRLPRQKLPQVR